MRKIVALCDKSNDSGVGHDLNDRRNRLNFLVNLSAFHIISPQKGERSSGPVENLHTLIKKKRLSEEAKLKCSILLSIRQSY